MSPSSHSEPSTSLPVRPHAQSVASRTLGWTAAVLFVPGVVVCGWAAVALSRGHSPRSQPASETQASETQVSSPSAQATTTEATRAPAAPAAAVVSPRSGAAAVDQIPGAGLALRLWPSSASPDAESDVRVARLCALTVADGQPFSPLFAPGPFRAELRGAVAVDVRDRYEFVVEGSGEVELLVGDKVVLQGVATGSAPLHSESVRLKKGANVLVLRYASPPAGEARVRLLWRSSEFGPEPVAPQRLSHDVAVAPSAGARARAEVARAMCTTCHAAPDARAPRHGAPDLRDAGARLDPGWVVEWLLHPVRSGSAPRQMPRFFADGDQGRKDAVDVTAYLATLSRPAADVEPAAGSAKTGGALFARLGCVGCHPRPGVTDASRIGLDHVGAKWRRAALVTYLRAPQAHDPGAHMPDFALSTDEAAALAAFLTAGGKAAPPPSAGDAARGRDLVESFGCAGCHALADLAPPAAPAFADVAARPAQVGADPCLGPPMYDAPGEPVAWALALSRVDRALMAEEAIAALRCTACHSRDATVDAWSAHAGEVADLVRDETPADSTHPEVAQTRPSLTWAGEKLTVAALASMISGAPASRARPWLHARMPAFPAHASELAEGLACGHGVALAPTETLPPDPPLVSVGEDLVSTKFFACVTCHGIGDQPPLQVFEVQGVNFARVGRRLRPDYFLRWMRSPQRVDPASKMPAYADARGKTAFTQVLEGDADRQFAAIWAWLRSLR